MKKFLFAAVLLFGVAFAAQSQEYKPFRVDGGLGYGIPFGDAYEGGVLFYVEPKYALNDKIAVGLRWEGALFGGAGEGVSIGLSSGYLATGDYYFITNKFRPFVGLGLGAHKIGAATFDVQGEDVALAGEVEGKTNFGGLVRAGFDFVHLRFALSYNYAGKIGTETHHYLGITVGFYIGGGKK
jgi:opacity protein-like surface antigen